MEFTFPEYWIIKIKESDYFGKLLDHAKEQKKKKTVKNEDTTKVFSKLIPWKISFTLNSHIWAE